MHFFLSGAAVSFPSSHWWIRARTVFLGNLLQQFRPPQDLVALLENYQGGWFLNKAGRLPRSLPLCRQPQRLYNIGSVIWLLKPAVMLCWIGQMTAPCWLSESATKQECCGVVVHVWLIKIISDAGNLTTLKWIEGKSFSSQAAVVFFHLSERKWVTAQIF